MENILIRTNLLQHDQIHVLQLSIIIIIFIFKDNFKYFTFYSSGSTKVFLSNPAITLSAAISKSIISTYFLFFLAANIAASLHKLAISAPENPGVKVANLLAHF